MRCAAPAESRPFGACQPGSLNGVHGSETVHSEPDHDYPMGHSKASLGCFLSQNAGLAALIQCLLQSL